MLQQRCSDNNDWTMVGLSVGCSCLKSELYKGWTLSPSLNGCGMGPLLVLVSACLKENVVVTCKIGSFL